MFYVGQKVECIYDKGQSCAPFVRKGEIYTISATHLRFLVGQCLEFYELPVNLDEVSEHACFPAKYFRLIVENKADISALKALLNPANHKQLEDA